jgi:hypothetical protein
VEVAHIERPGLTLIKKLFVVAASGLILFLAGSTPAHDENKDSGSGEKTECSITVNPQATITLCVASGTLTVRGWDKNELRVLSSDADHLEFRRIDKTKDPNVPPMRIDVMVLDKPSRANPKADCQAIADVQMEVPAGATVQVQTNDGDIFITGVAAAYAGSQNGDIAIERATKLVEAGTVGGAISLKDSSGRINLSSAGGGVEAANVRAAGADDTFEVGTVSGDIQLEHISSPRVMAKTVNGNLTMSGALVKSGQYAFTNMAGDVLLALPHDASFRLTAKVSEKRSIVSDFQLKYLNETPSPAPPAPHVLPRHPKPPVEEPEPARTKEKTKAATKEKPKPASRVEPAETVVVEKPTVVAPYVLRRVDAICGTGDAMISVSSFGGTVRLKKL